MDTIEIRDYSTSKTLIVLANKTSAINAWCDMTGYLVHHYSRKGKNRIIIAIHK